MYLRIALELHLKRLIVGGFDRACMRSAVFSATRAWIPEHNPEFTHDRALSGLYRL